MAGPERTLRRLVERGGVSIVLVALEGEAGIVHALGVGFDGTLRGMTPEESDLAGERVSDDALAELADDAEVAWPSWAGVSSIVVVHNVVEHPGRTPGEA